MSSLQMLDLPLKHVITLEVLTSF